MRRNRSRNLKALSAPPSITAHGRRLSGGSCPTYPGAHQPFRHFRGLRSPHMRGSLTSGELSSRKIGRSLHMCGSLISGELSSRKYSPWRCLPARVPEDEA